eukprot:TRINITY_DN3209_c0_g1_i1.p1 TRINITY_DN3209_c0_g1~~TRINITY_DN3209_c0_g1_i1.p1  ORF type:complete len:537 (+),score=170.29 TRINITY_DN3209_c0_g1_i1:36-1646(+)
MFSLKKKDDDRKPIEQEIADLQRRFRVLENDKRACAEDSQGTIRKQRATIEKLTRENRKMKQELNDTRAGNGSGPENKMSQDQLTKLNEHQQKMLARFEAESHDKETLQDKLDNTQKMIFELREQMAKSGGVNAALDNDKAVMKQIRILENRLDQSLQKFNTAIANNKSLRDDIDKLRRERGVFNQIYKKLENELAAKKKEMANIIEQANAAYEARDSAQAQMASLKQQADKEHAEFEKEWRELGKLIESDKRMKEFMRNKAANKEETQIDDKHKKKVAKNTWDATKSVAMLQNSEKKSEVYEAGFQQIQAATGISDIDELVHTFLEGEDTNFSLNQFNVLLQEQIEKLEQDISDYKEEIIILSGQSQRKEDTDKAKLLESLEERWNEVDRKAIHYEVKYQEAQQILSHIRASMESIYRRLGCTAEDLPVGCGGGISDVNMGIYLAIIEGRVDELLKLYDTLQGDDADAPRPRRAASGTTMNFRLPSTVEDDSDDEDDDDEDDQRPFTRDELKTKTMRGLSKKQKKGGRMKASGGD